MEFDNVQSFDSQVFDSSLILRGTIENYLAKWKWYLISLIFFLGLAFLFIWKQVPKYYIESTLLIKEQEGGNSVSGLEAFENLGVFGSSDNGVANEIHILNSRRLMKRVVNDLKLNVEYFLESTPHDIEYYPNFPLIVTFYKDSLDNIVETHDTPYSLFKIAVFNESRFEMIDSEGNSSGFKTFGTIFQTEFGKIDVSLNESIPFDEIRDKVYIVRSMPLDVASDIYSNSVTVELMDENSRILSLSTNSSIINKGASVLNNLIEQYNLDAVEDKNLVYKRTTEFLNERIQLITSELNAIELSAQQFKMSKGIIDPSTGSDIYLQTSTTNEKELINANTQLTLVNYVIGELDKNNLDQPLPVNVGLADESIIQLIQQYNTLVLQRIRVLKSSTDRNPLILSIDSQLLILVENMRSSLNNIRSSLDIQINSLNVQSGKLNSRIASVPKNEKEFKDIVRQLETKNAVYLFLLQKREESILSDAVNTNKGRVVDTAYSNGIPVSPNPKIIYLIGLLFGFLLPTSVIYTKELLDTKVHNEKDIIGLKLPYLGDIPFMSDKNTPLVSSHSDTPLAEAFRYLRTNIGFMLDRKENGKTVFVTSTQSHEGKTFASINLALSLAMAGKKVLIVTTDLRAPKMTKYLEMDEKIGITNYIKDSYLTVEDIIFEKEGIENLHFINSGDVPPNPVELLMSQRVSELFNYVQERYEYVIVDSAPVGMVTDTIQISHFADLTIYVVRANYLDKRMLHIPAKMNSEGKLNNMAILINGTDHSKGAYGYGYGYGEKKKKKKWWWFS